MSETKLGVILCIALLFLFPVSGRGMVASSVSGVTFLDTGDDGFHLTFGASVDMENGDMTYTIQERGLFKSELEWPLDNILYVGGTASANFLEKFQANAGIWKSVRDNAGATMKDSDWFFRIYGGTKAVYSETETAVDAIQFNTNLRYNFLQRESISLGAILGYSYTKWDWEAGNGFQATIDPFRFYEGPLPASSITYKETIQVPYLGLTLSMFPLRSSLGFNIYTLYSPLAQCDDEDDHILRSKLSTGQTDGTFLSLGGDVRWKFKGPWSLTGRINYTSYDLEGEQNQFFYAGEDAGTGFNDIDLEIEGSQVYLGFMIGYEL
jgi:outer membrane protease